jgi:hypothetical protein
MRYSYRGAATLLDLMLLPCSTKKSVYAKWLKGLRYFVKTEPGLTAIQRRRLRVKIAEVNRRAKRIIYAAGMYTNKRVPASRGRRVKMMPFGTWYFKPV